MIRLLFPGNRGGGGPSNWSRHLPTHLPVLRGAASLFAYFSPFFVTREAQVVDFLHLDS